MRTADFDLATARRTKGVEGVDASHVIILVPTKAKVTLEEAVDNALEKGDGDVLTDATVKFTHWYIPFIYGVTKWTVTGDVVKTRKT